VPSTPRVTAVTASSCVAVYGVACGSACDFGARNCGSAYGRTVGGHAGFDVGSDVVVITVVMASAAVRVTSFRDSSPARSLAFRARMFAFKSLCARRNSVIALAMVLPTPAIFFGQNRTRQPGKLRSFPARQLVHTALLASHDSRGTCRTLLSQEVSSLSRLVAVTLRRSHRIRAGRPRSVTRYRLFLGPSFFRDCWTSTGRATPESSGWRRASGSLAGRPRIGCSLASRCRPLILQFIGAQLVEEADAAASCSS